MLRSAPPAAARRGCAPHPGVLAVAATAGVALGVPVRPWLPTPEALAPLFGSALAARAVLAGQVEAWADAGACMLLTHHGADLPWPRARRVDLVEAGTGDDASAGPA